MTTPDHTPEQAPINRPVQHVLLAVFTFIALAGVAFAFADERPPHVGQALSLAATILADTAADPDPALHEPASHDSAGIASGALQPLAADSTQDPAASPGEDRGANLRMPDVEADQTATGSEAEPAPTPNASETGFGSVGMTSPESADPSTDTPGAEPGTDDDDEDDEGLGAPALSDPGPFEPATPIGPDPQGPQPGVELDPVGAETEPHPCDDVLAAGENLLVEDPIGLESGSMTSAVTILNCGAAAVDWTAATKPWVTLDYESGNLGPGSSTELGFLVDRDSVDHGAFEFKIKVSEPGANTYVDVYGFKSTLGSDFARPDSFSIGPPSCALGCLTRAELSSGVTSTTTSLIVETKVDAAITVWVSTAAPVEDSQGLPSLSNTSPVAASGALVSQFETSLGGLAPATEYHIVVEAIDALGTRDARAGTFRTVQPVALPDSYADPAPTGCAAECILEARIEPQLEFSTISIGTQTTVAAQIVVSVSTQAPATSDGVPFFASVEKQTQSPVYGTDWFGEISGLAADTSYHVIVRATDENGARAHAIGQFMTPPDPTIISDYDVMVMPLQAHIYETGDRVGDGELSFHVWAGSGSNWSGTGIRPTEKIGAGESFWFETSLGKFMDNVDPDTVLPRISVIAFEQDGAFFVENPITPNSPEWGEVPPVYDYIISTGGSHSVKSLSSLPRCSEFGIVGGWADLPCERFETFEVPGWPHLATIVGYHVADEIG